VRRTSAQGLHELLGRGADLGTAGGRLPSVLHLIRPQLSHERVLGLVHAVHQTLEEVVHVLETESLNVVLHRSGVVQHSEPAPVRVVAWVHLEVRTAGAPAALERVDELVVHLIMLCCVVLQYAIGFMSKLVWKS
jgi:hypothetical protein